MSFFRDVVTFVWERAKETPDEQRMREAQEARRRQRQQRQQPAAAHPNSPYVTHPMTDHPDDQYGFENCLTGKPRKKRERT